MRKYSDFIRSVAIAAFLLFVFLNLSSGEKMPKAGWGVPVLEESYVDLTDKRIDQIVSYGDTVYILFDSHHGFVHVYSSSGDYLYTLRFNDSAKGGF